MSGEQSIEIENSIQISLQSEHLASLETTLSDPSIQMLRNILDLSSFESARALLGLILVRKGQNEDGSEWVMGGRIVETEYYCHSDPASHSYKGLTARTKTMFAGIGLAYVYLIYGMHYCLNVTAGEPGSAILIRALEPLYGIQKMREHRNYPPTHTIAKGPGNLTKALLLDRNFDGMNLLDSNQPLHLHIPTEAAHSLLLSNDNFSLSPLIKGCQKDNGLALQSYNHYSSSLNFDTLKPPYYWQNNQPIQASSRIGISKAIHNAWRFYFEDSPYVCRNSLIAK